MVGAAVGVVEAAKLSREMARAGANDTVYVVDGSRVNGGKAPNRAALYAMGIGTAVNCAAFFALILVPAALLVRFMRRGAAR